MGGRGRLAETGRPREILKEAEGDWKIREVLSERHLETEGDLRRREAWRVTVKGSRRLGKTDGQ